MPAHWDRATFTVVFSIYEKDRTASKKSSGKAGCCSCENASNAACGNSATASWMLGFMFCVHLVPLLQALKIMFLLRVTVVESCGMLFLFCFCEPLAANQPKAMRRLTCEFLYVLWSRNLILCLLYQARDRAGREEMIGWLGAEY
ncbi:unnamed protein product [Ostreobium quekettii]|uniref:SWIM-type domain-containing protein n=1 Tax=Ostreobium quekettii TaxID=121088 RepID=A0A8S1IUE6_9CHLO|nr:unnamed protein product [Ostreobium quekettii]